ncbi:hypothetical protein, partial [Nonomuraea antimicrobica]|uniref:hypothetical protein n=1 Tax=Nonomuraea antimicrobica TaxID=561173 RepID=UPI0031F17A84
GLRAALAGPVARRALTAHQVVFELDRARTFDAYQLHYYDHWSLAPDVLDYVKDAGLPVEAWEVGSFWPGSGYDPAAHGAETAKLVTHLLAGGVRKLVYLPVYHSPGEIAGVETWRALYGADGRPRPARSVLDRLKAYSSGQWRRLPAVEGGVEGGAVAWQGGTVLVLWSERPVELRPPSGTVVTTAALPGGPARPLTGGRPLAVGATPVLVTVRAPIEETMKWLRAS